MRKEDTFGRIWHEVIWLHMQFCNGYIFRYCTNTQIRTDSILLWSMNQTKHKKNFGHNVCMMSLWLVSILISCKWFYCVRPLYCIRQAWQYTIRNVITCCKALKEILFTRDTALFMFYDICINWIPQTLGLQPPNSV